MERRPPGSFAPRRGPVPTCAVVDFAVPGCRRDRPPGQDRVDRAGAGARASPRSQPTPPPAPRFQRMGPGGRPRRPSSPRPLRSPACSRSWATASDPSCAPPPGRRPGVLRLHLMRSSRPSRWPTPVGGGLVPSAVRLTGGVPDLKEVPGHRFDEDDPGCGLVNAARRQPSIRSTCFARLGCRSDGRCHRGHAVRGWPGA